MILSENRCTSRIKSGTGFFGIMREACERRATLDIPIHTPRSEMKHDFASATDAMARIKPARQKEGPKLNDEHREYIVRRLAAYERPNKVRREVRERFGIAVSRPAIDHYDPTRSPACGKPWAELFYTVRRAHVGGQSDEASKSRKVERLVLRTVATLADRILNGLQAEAQDLRCRRDHRRGPPACAGGFRREAEDHQSARRRGAQARPVRRPRIT